MTDAVSLVMHDEEQNVPVAMNFLDSTGQILRVPKKDGEAHNIVLTISTEMVTRLNTKEAPCHDETSNTEGKGLFECLEEHFQESVGHCLMPWNFGKRTNSNLSMCDRNVSQQYKSYIDQLIKAPSHQKLYKSTGCISSCQSNVSSITSSGPSSRVCVIEVYSHKNLRCTHT